MAYLFCKGICKGTRQEAHKLQQGDRCILATSCCIKAQKDVFASFVSDLLAYLASRNKLLPSP